MMEGLNIFHKAKVGKMFPAYQDEPFPGIVYKVDDRGKDDKPFKIHYEDGDAEWITLEELAEILVDRPLKAKAKEFMEHGLRAEPSSKKRTQQQAGAAAAPAAAPKKAKAAAAPKPPAARATKATPPAAAAAAPAPAAAAAAALEAANKPRSSKPKATSNPPAGAGVALAAADTGREAPAGSSKQQKPAGKAAAGPAAAAAAGGSRGPGSGAVTPAELAGIVQDVVQAAPKQADRLLADASIMRLPYRGPGSSSLPMMSQAVVCGPECFFTVYGSAPRAPNYSSPIGTAPIDYRADAQDALQKLQDLLDGLKVPHKVHKRMLTRVRVYLRNMEEGLPAFREAWNAWVDAEALPVLTVLQGSGPISSAGVVLEAQLYMGTS